MKALRLALSYLGMFAVVLGGVLVVNRLSRPAARPWPETGVGLSADRATAAPGQVADAAGLSVQVLGTRTLAAREVVDAVRLSSKAQAQPGQVFLLLTLQVSSRRTEPVTLRAFGPEPSSTFLLGLTEPRQKTLEPILPGDVARLGETPLDDGTLPPGGVLRGTVGFVLDKSERGTSLLIVPTSRGKTSFPAFELGLE